ncbi:Pentatricopeptide repeat [Dillenia turbinata]|uniref:Pentatricopeptide repeat n=1 Tax=Dillenia turbinata TaxID=194707 RepID=A0AAN8V6D5_9MAGN
MREFGVLPDEFTFTSLLSVSAQTCDLDLGRFVHLCMEVNGVGSDLHVKNALVDMYGKCGQLDIARYIFEQMHNKNVITWTSMLNAYAKHGLIDFAQQCFDQMPMKNVVSWNCMMSCFVQEGRCREAYNLFCRMCNSGVSPDENSLISILSASSQLGDLVMGKEIHGYILANNITPSVTLSNSLVDMYAKCGPVERALGIFFEMPKRNLVSWNVLIGALALHGRGSEAVDLFKGMVESGIKPDEITFTGLLSACSHSAGRWDDVKKIRKLMNDHTIEKCRAISSIEIDGCVCQFMVDDRRHESWDSIQIMLDQLNDHLKFAGYRYNLSSSLLEEKEI